MTSGLRQVAQFEPESLAQNEPKSLREVAQFEPESLAQ
jgi:hypothetical protein